MASPPGTARAARRPRGALAVSAVGIVVSGAMQVVRVASMAALVFAGFGPAMRADGLGLALIGTTVATLWIALRSSLPGVQGSAQSVSIAILVVAVDAAAARTAPDAVVGTVFALVALSGVVTGLGLLALGATGAARLVRYLPHPVVAGVLAASGWILVASAIRMMIPTAGVGALTPGAIVHWAPGLAIGVWLFALTRAVRHPMVVPGVLVAATAAFYAVARVNGYGVAELTEGGWLFGPLPSGSLWRAPPADAWLQADPAVLLSQGPALATVAFVTALSTLLFTSGMELERDVDADPGRELRETGFGNLLGAAFGGLAATVTPTGSRLAASMRARRRIDAALAALVAAAVLTGGSGVLARTPLAVLGGLLVYLGVEYLTDYLILGWRRLSKLDMAVVVTMVATVATVGLLPGVAVGLVVTVVMFVVATARTEVVARPRSGRELRSRVTRSAAARERLWNEGERIAVLRLGGTVFFGTADRLATRAKARLATDPTPRFVLLDVTDASTFDATGALAVMRIARAARRVGAEVIVVGAGPALQRALARAEADVRTEDDLDRALETAEDALLRETGLPDDRPRFADATRNLPGGAATWDAVAPYFGEVRLDAGAHVARQGDAPDGFWILESGRVTAVLDRTDAPPLRLETLAPGQVLGELGFVTGRPRSAHLVADEATVLRRMDRDGWDALARERPEAAIALRDLLLRLAAERIEHLSVALASARG